MAENITFEENKLILPTKTVPFRHKIEQILETDLRVFVLLDIPNDVDNNENIYCFTKTGDLVWLVQPVSMFNPNIKQFSPYVGMHLLENGNISATNFFGINYEVSARNGKILSSKMVK